MEAGGLQEKGGRLLVKSDIVNSVNKLLNSTELKDNERSVQTRSHKNASDESSCPTLMV